MADRPAIFLEERAPGLNFWNNQPVELTDKLNNHNFGTNSTASEEKESAFWIDRSRDYNTIVDEQKLSVFNNMYYG